ncbi:MAG: hypothetical protein EOO05_12380 [Chitinophagaceae bacterium]|nr:MAG: hypothetical protein EOO05_12380 [Chitinophagaceae bacterium]
MKKVFALAIVAVAFLSACNNESDRVGNVKDTSKVSPPTEKQQDSTSLTDTGYRIGDSVR